MASSLRGVWKISTALRSGSVASVPRRIRFDESPPSLALQIPMPPGAAPLDTGAVAIPYSEQCKGSWAVAAARQSVDEETSGALHAGFVVECTAREGEKASRLAFQGLFDGERLAGTVTDDATGHELGEFLCTRLFTFWGAPKVKASME